MVHCTVFTPSKCSIRFTRGFATLWNTPDCKLHFTRIPRVSFSRIPREQFRSEDFRRRRACSARRSAIGAKQSSTHISRTQEIIHDARSLAERGNLRLRAPSGMHWESEISRRRPPEKGESEESQGDLLVGRKNLREEFWYELRVHIAPGNRGNIASRGSLLCSPREGFPASNS